MSAGIGIAYAAAIGYGNTLQYEQNIHPLLLILLAAAGTGVIYLGYGWLETVTEKNTFTRKQSLLWFAVTIALLLLMWLPGFIFFRKPLSQPAPETMRPLPLAPVS